MQVLRELMMEEKRKVLIAEDEVLVREGLKSAVNWARLGMEVIGDAANGKQAFEIYEKERPDILLTDIRMPGMDGLELIARIREADTKTKIVILTCYEEFSYLQEAMRMGVSDYILKLKMKPADIEAAMEKLKLELERNGESRKKGVVDYRLQKEELLKQYIFYHQIPIETFRSRLEKLNLSVDEKNIVLCRMVLQKYEKLQSRMMDEQGMLIRFLIQNMTEEIVRKYGKGELIQEKENCFLLLVNLRHLGEEGEEELRKMLREITRALADFMEVQIAWKYSGIYQSLSCLSQMYQECCKTEQDAGLSVEIYNAVKYIEEHLTERLNLNQVAEHIGLSTNYLSSLFKKEMGISFVDYVAEKRVEKAEELLKNTDMKTWEVAERTGFVDESYFSKTFKRITGKRPSAYRKRERI